MRFSKQTQQTLLFILASCRDLKVNRRPCSSSFICAVWNERKKNLNATSSLRNVVTFVILRFFLIARGPVRTLNLSPNPVKSLKIT